MTKMKTIFVVIFLVLLIPVLLKAPESEAKVYRGKCKNNLTWSYNTKTKTMIIDCKGDMPDDKQFYGLDMGWKEYYLHISHGTLSPHFPVLLTAPESARQERSLQKLFSS